GDALAARGRPLLEAAGEVPLARRAGRGSPRAALRRRVPRVPRARSALAPAARHARLRPPRYAARPARNGRRARAFYRRVMVGKGWAGATLLVVASLVFGPGGAKTAQSATGASRGRPGTPAPGGLPAGSP